MQKWYEFRFKKRHFYVNTLLCIFYRSKSNLQILKTEYQLTEYQLNNDVTITSFCFVNKSAAGHPGTEVSACKDLWRDAICKSIANFRKRLRACINAYDGHSEHCCNTADWFDLCLLFLQHESKKVLKMLLFANSLLILRPCSVEIFALNVQSFIISEVLK